MKKIGLYDTAGQKQSEGITIGLKISKQDVSQKTHACVVRSLLQNWRQATVGCKSRGEVSFSTKKPWRQKGTGRARSGTIRSPLWRSGGKTFAATTRDYSQKANKKAYRAAIRSILSELVRQDRLVVVDSFAVDAPKTRELLGKLRGMELERVLIVHDEPDENLYLAARNLAHVDVVDTSIADPVSLVGFDKVLMTANALRQFEERLA